MKKRETMKCIYCSQELKKGRVELGSRYRPKYYSDEELENKKGVNSFLQKGISLSLNQGLSWYCPSCQKVFYEFETRETIIDKLNHIVDGEE